MAAVKALQQWCKVRCDGYRDVAITNMTTSFRDGLAFCALIHKHRPDLIDFDSLRKDDVYENNKLAFRVAEEELGIPALLDAEDMVALRVPDRLSILTYVSQYYNYFHGRSPIGGLGGIKRPADVPPETPSGKKNQAVVSKVFPPSSKPARENSPPPSPNVRRPSPSPRRTVNATKDSAADKHQTGTLSNRCVSCQQLVHLVQRHLVDGKLYHRHCAKSLSPANSSTLFRGLPTNPPAPRPDSSKPAITAPPDSSKAAITAPTHTPSRLGPSWLPEKPRPPPSSSSSSSPPSAAPVVLKPTSPRPTITTATTSIITTPTPAPRTSTTAAKTQQTKLRFLQTDNNGEKKTTTTSNANFVVNKWPDVTGKTTTTTTSNANFVVNKWPDVTGKTTTTTTTTSNANFVVNKWPDVTGKTTTTTTTTSNANFVVNKWPDVTGKTTTTTTTTSNANFVVNKWPDVTGKTTTTSTSNANFVVNKLPDMTGKTTTTTAAAGQPVTMVLNVGGLGRKEADVGGAKAAKAAAAAFISKKLSEENNNNNKPAWADVELKKTDKSPQPETPVKEVGGVRGRKLLKVDRSILADLDVPRDARTPSPAGRSGGAARPRSASPTTSASENESPADWRSKLKPISKPAAPTPSSPKPWTRGVVKTSEPAAGPPPSSQPPAISVTPPAAKSLLNGQKDSPANGTKTEKVAKTKPDYILKEDILKELQDIEDNLNAWERRGVELELKLRSSEDEGEDDSVMDELMVEWFNLIRNKQVAMRRESELVYIGKTQDLEEEQPSVEKELRRLMEKPERLKTAWDRQREDQLMAKLVEIVNDRNAIVEGLDEDRLREEEEDEELNKMMMNFSLKKDKPKKKSPMSKLFGLGKKKDG